MRLEQLTIGDRVLADELREGRGLRAIDVDGGGLVAGWIWGRRFSPTPTTALAARIRAARLALGQASLDDAAVASLGALAGAVTQFASLLADGPGWSPGGLPDDDLGWSGGGSWSSACGLPVGLGGYGTIGHGAGTGTGTDEAPPELGPLLAVRVAGCAAGLEASPWRLELAVAVTGDEVVDVTAVAAGVADAAARARLEACALEAGWDLDLDARFARYRRTFTATFAR